MDSVPIVCLSGQVPTHLIGNDAFQEADTTGITRPCTKHNYLVKESEKLCSTLHEAFHVARSGRPGPVVVDLPKDIQLSESPTERELKLRKFELDLISELGYEFSLTLDSKGKKIKEDLIYEFIPSKGFQEVNKENLKDVILGLSLIHI